jgi:hypothetical protein
VLSFFFNTNLFSIDLVQSMRGVVLMCVCARAVVGVYIRPVVVVLRFILPFGGANEFSI